MDRLRSVRPGALTPAFSLYLAPSAPAQSRCHGCCIPGSSIFCFVMSLIQFLARTLILVPGHSHVLVLARRRRVRPASPTRLTGSRAKALSSPLQRPCRNPHSIDYDEWPSRDVAWSVPRTLVVPRFCDRTMRVRLQKEPLHDSHH